MAIFASDIQRTILEYYGENSTIWQRMQLGEATETEIIRALESAPQVQPIYSANGAHVLGYDWAEPRSADLSEFNSIISSANSNAGQHGYTNNGVLFNIPSNWGNNGGRYTLNSGATTSVGGRLATIADKMSLAVTGVNLGAKLGAAIDRAIYSVDPDWWDTHYPSINPDTWTNIATNEGGKQFIRTLFGVDQNGATTAYVDQRVLAQTYQLFRDLGLFDESGANSATSGLTTILPQPIRFHDSTILFTGPDTLTGQIIPHNGAKYVIIQQGENNKLTIFVTGGPDAYVECVSNRIYQGNPLSQTLNYRVRKNYRYDDKVVYYHDNTANALISQYRTPYIAPDVTLGDTFYGDGPSAWTINYGDVTSPTAIDGINPIGQSYPYPPTNITGTTLEDVLTQLRTEYPDLFTDSITQGTIQDDGTIEEITYISVPWAVTETEPQAQPVTRDETEITTQVDDKVIVDLTTETEMEDKTTDPPDTGEGTSETVVIPTGSASSLWAVYHPSQAQLNAFGAWLWSSDFVEQIKRLFNDPMQAIIGVHKVFAPIPTGGTQNIKCGYLDSGCPSPIVTSQYTDVNCGTVSVSEYFGNVFDYDPHTKISLYLPFIGVVPLKTSEVMRSSVNVTYGVDVITGACLAKVRITRDGAGGILYSYGGSCACHYPISSGSYAGIISGIVTSAIGIAGGIATGNPLATIGGAVAGLHQAHTDVQRSGGFTGCAGAMGPKKPFLIIDRPQTRIATDVAKYSGKPSNATQFIGDCTGFVRAVEVHFSAPGAFDDEAKEIEALLKSGVLISD